MDALHMELRIFLAITGIAATCGDSRGTEPTEADYDRSYPIQWRHLPP